MTITEQLMVIAMEECNEVAQRISKALRFGMEQVQEDADDAPEQNPERLTNRERIYREYWDLRATLGMMGIDAWANSSLSKVMEEEKTDKIHRYMQRSRKAGTLEE